MKKFLVLIFFFPIVAQAAEYGLPPSTFTVGDQVVAKDTTIYATDDVDWPWQTNPQANDHHLALAPGGWMCWTHGGLQYVSRMRIDGMTNGVYMPLIEIPEDLNPVINGNRAVYVVSSTCTLTIGMEFDTMWKEWSFTAPIDEIIPTLFDYERISSLESTWEIIGSPEGIHFYAVTPGGLIDITDSVIETEQQSVRISDNGNVLHTIRKPEAYSASAVVDGTVVIDVPGQVLSYEWDVQAASKCTRFDPTYQEGVGGFSGTLDVELQGNDWTNCKGDRLNVYTTGVNPYDRTCLIAWQNVQKGKYTADVYIKTSAMASSGEVRMRRLRALNWVDPDAEVKPANGNPSWMYSKYAEVAWGAAGVTSTIDVEQEYTALTIAADETLYHYALGEVSIGDTTFGISLKPKYSGTIDVTFYDSAAAVVTDRPRLILTPVNRFDSVVRDGNNALLSAPTILDTTNTSRDWLYEFNGAAGVIPAGTTGMVTSSEGMTTVTVEIPVSYQADDAVIHWKHAWDGSGTIALPYQAGGDDSAILGKIAEATIELLADNADFYAWAVADSLLKNTRIDDSSKTVVHVLRDVQSMMTSGARVPPVSGVIFSDSHIEQENDRTWTWWMNGSSRSNTVPNVTVQILGEPPTNTLLSEGNFSATQSWDQRTSAAGAISHTSYAAGTLTIHRWYGSVGIGFATSNLQIAAQCRDGTFEWTNPHGIIKIVTPITVSIGDLVTQDYLDTSIATVTGNQSTLLTFAKASILGGSVEVTRWFPDSTIDNNYNINGATVAFYCPIDTSTAFYGAAIVMATENITGTTAVYLVNHDRTTQNSAELIHVVTEPLLLQSTIFSTNTFTSSNSKTLP